MPKFFDPNNLTQEQKNNWDRAIRDYKKVQQDNIEHKIEHLSQLERDFYKKEGFVTDDQIQQQMRVIMDMTGNKPGHPKSSLFARLLDGKQALPSPPPTSYSYPWYSLIEGDDIHSVCIDTWNNWISSDAKQLKITINQCSWLVKSLNNAARTLLNLNEELQRTVKTVTNTYGLPDVQHYTWTQELFEKVKAAYAEKPEFIVQFGNNPEFHLYVGNLSDEKKKRQARKKFLLQISQRDVESMVNIRSVFDLDLLRMNLEIGKTVFKTEHPLVKLEKLKEHCAQNDSPDFLKKLDAANLENTSKSLQNDIAEFERDPDAQDVVEYTADQWLLKKLA